MWMWTPGPPGSNVAVVVSDPPTEQRPGLPRRIGQAGYSQTTPGVTDGACSLWRVQPVDKCCHHSLMRTCLWQAVARSIPAWSIVALLTVLTAAAVSAQSPSPTPSDALDRPASVTIETITDPPDHKGTFTFLDVAGSLTGVDISAIDASTLLGLLSGGGSIPGIGIPIPDLSEFFTGPYEVAANGSLTAELPSGVRSLVLLDAPSGLVPQGIECRDATGGFVASVGLKSPFDDPSIVTLDLAPGAEVTCTFGARFVPSTSVTLTPVTDGSDPAAVFVFHHLPGSLEELLLALGEALSGPFAGLFPDITELDAATLFGGLEPIEIVADESVTIGGLPPGSHTLILGELPEGATVEDISCRDASGAAVGTVDPGLLEEPRLVGLDLAPGDAVSCDYLIALDRPASRSALIPRAGIWRAVNEVGAISCDGFVQKLPKSQRDKGRIQVKQGGRTLVATGIAEGKKTRVVLKRDDTDADTWKGKLKVREQGVSMTLNYEVQRVDEAHLEGSMQAKFSAAGRRCELNRDFRLTYAGK